MNQEGITRASVVTLAFLIENAMDQWEMSPHCPTRERAAANALLDRYDIHHRQDLEPTDPLDIEALALFRVSGATSAVWHEFTERQRNHWRAVATKAREIYDANPRYVNIELAARALQANTHDSQDNSKDWEDMTWHEREPWRDRVLMVIRAGQEA